MLLTNCENNLILTCSENELISNSTSAGIRLCSSCTFLNSQDNTRLLNQFKSGLNKTITWNKYQSDVTIEIQNQYFAYLICPVFQALNRPFL